MSQDLGPAEGEPQRIVVMPNISLSPRGAVVFFLVVAVAALTVATGMALQGYWPVLPFAGAELLLLAICLYLVQRRRRYREVITLDDERLVVERGLGRPEEIERFNRAWVRVELDPPAHRNHPVRLYLREGRHQCEIGQCLPEGERVSLGERLKALVAAKD